MDSQAEIELREEPRPITPTTPARDLTPLSIACLGLFPWLLYWFNPTIFFGNAPAGFDFWYMHGYMRDFFGVYELGAHQNARLPWTLVGLAFHNIFPGQLANLLLHVGCFYCVIFGSYFSLRQIVSERQAFVASFMLGFHGHVASHVGVDYMIAGALAYQGALIPLLIYSARLEGWKRYAALTFAGAMAGSIAYCHFMLAPFLVPLFFVYSFARQEVTGDGHFRGFFASLGFANLGILLLTLLLGTAMWWAANDFWFFRSALNPSISLIKNSTVWRMPFDRWMLSSWWPHLIPLTLLSLVTLFFAKNLSQTVKGVLLLLPSYLALALAMDLGIGLAFFHGDWYPVFLLPPAYFVVAIALLDGLKDLDTPRYLGTAACLAFAAAMPWFWPHHSMKFTALLILAGTAISLCRNWRFPLVLLLLAATITMFDKYYFPRGEAIGERYYERIDRSIAEIKRFRIEHKGKAPKFWYGKPDLGHFRDLANNYMSHVPDQNAFPKISESYQGGVLVLCSYEKPPLDQARTALKSRGFKILAEREVQIEDGASGWFLTLFNAVKSDPDGG